MTKLKIATIIIYRRLINCIAFVCLFIIWLSHEDWDLPNLRIWLAPIHIDRGLDFPI